MKDLPLSNDIVKTRIKEVTDKVADLAEKCKELHKDDLHAFEEKVVTISADVSTVKSTLAEQAAAVNWKLKQASSKMRSEYQTKRWKASKLAQRLVGGGHRPRHAMFVAEMVLKLTLEELDRSKISYVGGTSEKASLLIDPAGEDVDSTRMMAFTKNGEDCLMKPLFDKVQEQVEEMGKKGATLSLALENNAKWPGSFGILGALATPDEIGSFAALSDSASKGARPWMMCMRKNHKRFGPIAVPAAGAPTVFMPTSFCTGTFIHAYHVAPNPREGHSPE